MKKNFYFLLVTACLLLPCTSHAQISYQATFGWEQNYTDACDHDNFYVGTADNSFTDVEDAGLDRDHTYQDFSVGPEYAVSVTTVFYDPGNNNLLAETGHSNIVWISKDFQPGDANHDGSININDINFTMLNRGKPITPENIGCDVWPIGAPDNKIDNYDVIQIKKYVAAATS